MDVGTIVNPDGVRAQIEGSVLWGTSLAMLENGTMKDGGIEQTNFDSYTPMRMSQMPEIDVSIIVTASRRWVAANRRSPSWRRRSAMPSSTRSAPACARCRSPRKR